MSVYTGPQIVGVMQRKERYAAGITLTFLRVAPDLRLLLESWGFFAHRVSQGVHRL